jgi:hypothetical protein
MKCVKYAVVGITALLLWVGATALCVFGVLGDTDTQSW